MHELSICQSILKTIEEELDAEQLEHVREIHLKVGLLSCVEPKFLEHVFRFMIVDSQFSNAKLHVDRIDVLAECDICAEQFKVENYKFVCPNCGRPVSNVIEGNELLIHKIILNEPAYEKAN